jgi:micrococcal nuclease
MTEFTVNEIIDGDSFKVENDWEWDGKKGDTIRPSGYNTPEKGESGYEEAKQKLKGLILNEKVEIKNPMTIDDWGRLIADVYYNGKHLADYFSEYKT